MSNITLQPPYDISAPDDSAPGTPIAELQRAVAIVLPSLSDPKLTATVIRNVLRARGFEISKVKE